MLLPSSNTSVLVALEETLWISFNSFFLFVKLYRLSLLFLLETKMRDFRARNFMWSLGYGGSYAVGSDGLSGGCVIFWVASMIVSVKAFNELCIDV